MRKDSKGPVDPPKCSQMIAVLSKDQDKETEDLLLCVTLLVNFSSIHRLAQYYFAIGRVHTKFGKCLILNVVFSRLEMCLKSEHIPGKCWIFSLSPSVVIEQHISHFVNEKDPVLMFAFPCHFECMSDTSCGLPLMSQVSLMSL